MNKEEKEKFVEKYNKKKKEIDKKRKTLRFLFFGAVICAVLGVSAFMFAQHLSATPSKSFYVYYADCPVCKKDLPKLNKDGKYPSYEFTNDKTKIVNEIGFDKYEKITSHRVPVKVTVNKDTVEYVDNPLK